MSIPKTVAFFSGSAFAFCTGLTAVIVDPLNPLFSSRDGVVFDKQQESLLISPAGKVGSYVIPHGVTMVGHESFAGCKGLNAVTNPNSVTSIGWNAFDSCTGLTVVGRDCP